MITALQAARCHQETAVVVIATFHAWCCVRVDGLLPLSVFVTPVDYRRWEEDCYISSGVTITSDLTVGY